MPPRKKKTLKTPQKTKPSTPSPTATATATATTSPEPSLAGDPPSVNVSSTQNFDQPEPKPQIKIELAPEPATAAPEVSEPASEEPAVAIGSSEAHEVNPDGIASDEPAEKPGTKTVLRVRKVVKKKIVKKLVPKGSVAAKKLDAVQQQDDAVSVADCTEKERNPNFVLDGEVQHGAAEVGFNPNGLQQGEPLSSVLEIKEECRQVDGKDEVLKSRKVARKRIVKKLVPKGSLAAKKVEASPLVLKSVKIEKDLDESSAMDSTLQQAASEKALSPDANQLPEVKMEEDDKLELGKFEDNVEIKEECEEMEVKDENLESGKEGDGLEAAGAKGPEVVGLSERMKRRKSEIFIGGLDRDTKEEDIRSVFEKVGEILEIRLMMDGQTGKNKGYAFLRYVEPSQAKRAVTEFAKVEIRGKICGAAVVQGNDTIFLGSIDKKWKKEDVMKFLKENVIENVETITVVMDPNNSDLNRGFAFVELETNRDAQRALKKLQKKDGLGMGRNIKAAWADALHIPDEEDLLKVKSVYAEGVPDSWDEDRLKEKFEEYGEIERIVLGKNIKSAKRRDIAFINYKTREAALSCIESFSSDDLTDNGSEVNLKVTLAKRAQKANQNKGQKSAITNSQKAVLKPVQGLPPQDYSSAVLGTKRTFSALGDGIYSDLRGYPRSRLDSTFGLPGSSYGVMPHVGVASSLHYQHQSAPSGYSSGSFYGSGSSTDAYQIRQGVPPYSSSLHHHRYQM